MMGIDLLRHQQKWKDSLLEIRQIMANLVSQVCGWASIMSLDKRNQTCNFSEMKGS